jgi:hypothetical protein
MAPSPLLSPLPLTLSSGMMLEVSECVESTCKMRWMKPHLNRRGEVRHLGLWQWQYVGIGLLIIIVKIISIEALIVDPTFPRPFYDKMN